jgi:hypothetical protein
MAGQSIVASTGFAESVGIATILMKRISGAAFLRNLLVHLFQSNRHDCGQRTRITPNTPPWVSMIIFVDAPA